MGGRYCAINEFRGEGKNPETGGRGIFAPHHGPMVSYLRNADCPWRLALTYTLFAYSLVFL